MYYLIYLIIYITTVKEVLNRRINYLLFFSMYFLLTIMLIFRYGQGQDYFNYQQLYNEIGYLGDISPYLLLTRPDIGYTILCYVSYSFQLPFFLFVAFIGIVTMYWFYLFFVKYCGKSMLSLFFFYSVIYLIYPFSILRQGIAIAFFVGILLPLIENRKYVKYYIYTVLLSMIHLSAIIMVLFPIMWNAKLSKKWILLIFSLLSISMLFEIQLFTHIPISFINERVEHYVESSSNNLIFAKLVRLLIVFPLFFFPNRWLREDSYMLKMRNMLFGGFVVYALLSFSELAASRLWGYFLVFECIMLFRLLCQKSFLKFRFFLLSYYILLNNVLWFKDINGFIQQGEYQNCTILTYPYISLFDNENTLYYYRTYFGTVNDIE